MSPGPRKGSQTIFLFDSSGDPLLVQQAGNIGGGETEGKCEQSFATSMDAGDLFLVSQDDSVVASALGATADIVCFSWLARHNRNLGRRGIPRVATYPSRERFRFGDGRLGEVRYAADIPAGIAGNRGVSTAFVLDADIPALSRRGSMEALGGQLGFFRASRG